MQIQKVKKMVRLYTCDMYVANNGSIIVTYNSMFRVWIFWSFKLTKPQV